MPERCAARWGWPRTGNYTNSNLADYLVATAADVPSVEALIIEDDDSDLSPAGIKGVGEISIIGVNAAITNAIFAATGQRFRRLPIRLEDLSGSHGEASRAER